MENTIEEHLLAIHPELLEIFDKNESTILAGSTVLYYYLLKNKIEPGFIPDDLDIFCRTSYAIPEFFKKFKMTLNTTYYGNSTMFVLDCTISGKKINLIVNKNDNYYFNTKDMLKTTDFDFTKCYFNGKTIKLIDETLHDNILEKKCILEKYVGKCNKEPKDLLEYISKIKSGEVISPENDISKLYHRMQKYINRGFTFDTSNFRLDKKSFEQSMVWSVKNYQKKLIESIEPSIEGSFSYHEYHGLRFHSI